MPRPLLFDIAAGGGLCRRADLVARGHETRAVTASVGRGELRVPRRGWVASPGAPPDALRAVELGGILGGASALASFGIWVDDDPLAVVVSCTRSASRLPPLAPGERRIWWPTRAASTFPWRVSVVVALLQYARTVPRDSLIASVDSALNKRLLTPDTYRTFLACLPARLRSIAVAVDSGAMSGTETHMRLPLMRAGYQVRTQVKIPGVGTVDILIDEWLIIELDSKKHHDGQSNQHRDRTRDGNAVLGNYGHERFMWQQVYYANEWCMSVVAARLSEREAFNRQ